MINLSRAWDKEKSKSPSGIEPTTDLQIAFSFLVKEDFSHTGRELQQVEAFSLRTVGGPLVSEAPAEANHITVNTA